MKRTTRQSRRVTSFEPLEGRQLMSVATAPAPGGLTADVSQIVFGGVVGGAASTPRTVTLTNRGDVAVTIPAGGVTVGGTSATMFSVTPAAEAVVVLAPGQSLGVAVSFGATAIGPQGATLDVLTDDGSGAGPVTSSVALRGLGTKGEQGVLEPSLQWILDTYRIAARTGDADPVEPTLAKVLDANDEVKAPLFTRAGPGPVSIVPIAVYSGEASPALALGYYTKSSATTIARKQLYTVPAPDVQTMTPRVDAGGTTEFDPGLATFGLYSTWAAQKGRTVYSEDFRNTFIGTDPVMQQMFKVYPLTTADGAVVPDAYVVGNEEAFNRDYQDAVYVIRNVRPAQSFPAAAPVAPVTGLMLVNADTGRDIGPLVNGQTIDFAALGTNRLSVRAVVDGTPGSVKFVTNGLSRVESTAPYTINGDANGTYAAWTPKLGANALTVTPYANANAGGAAGTPVVVNFNVVLKAPTPTPAPLPTPEPTPTQTPAPMPVVYQAEQAKLAGATIAKENAGYSGGGYADFQNNAGDSIRWDVTSAAAGSVKLTFRYANGGATNRALSLKVNGVTVHAALAFNATGGWGTWKTVTVTVQLAAGLNSILLSTIGANGANIDSLTVG